MRLCNRIHAAIPVTSRIAVSTQISRRLASASSKKDNDKEQRIKPGEFVDKFKSLSEAMKPSIDAAIQLQKQGGDGRDLSGLLGKSKMQALKSSAAASASIDSACAVEHLPQERIQELFVRLDQFERKRISLDEISDEFSLRKETLLSLHQIYKLPDPQ